jgi:hypothetical protein
MALRAGVRVAFRDHGGSATITVVSRAQEERRRWPGGLVRPEEHAELERRFWADASPAQRIDAMLQLLTDASMMEGDGAPPRLQRHLGGVRRGQG